MNDYSIYLLDALEQVLGHDLPDESLISEATQQAMLMTGCFDQYEGSTFIDSH